MAFRILREAEKREKVEQMKREKERVIEEKKRKQVYSVMLLSWIPLMWHPRMKKGF